MKRDIYSSSVGDSQKNGLVLLILKEIRRAEMFTLEDLPCALYFTICDIWLTDTDLIRLDLSLTSLERRGKYLSILSYSKV
ncbi:hypothetical protein EON65_40200 [archaeon]|nr:MAG: hypothetical protein EON65_40200 [archaeon]